MRYRPLLFVAALCIASGVAVRSIGATGSGDWLKRWHPPHSIDTPQEWVQSYPVNDSDEMSFHIYLKLDPDTPPMIEKLALQLSDRDNHDPYLTADEVIDLVTTPTVKENHRQVCDWLHSEGVDTDSVCESLGDSIVCRTDIQTINRLFSVTMYRYDHPTEPVSYPRSSTDYVIPDKLKGSVEFIEGLSHLPSPEHFSTRDSPTPVAAADPGYVALEVVQRMYNLTFNHVHNPQTTVAAIEFGGGGFSQSDLDSTAQKNLVKAQPVSCVLGANPGGGTESKLDMQMLEMVAGGVNLCYINYESNFWACHMFSNLTATKDPPGAVSVSYGWAEWDQCDIITCTNETAAQYVNRSNFEASKLALRGVSVFVSSGDAGAPGRTNEGCTVQEHQINPAYPGSSPWVTAVGATFVKSSPSATFSYHTPACTDFQCANGTETQTVSNDAVGWTAGGGFGIFGSEDRASHASWQDTVVSEYLKSGVDLPNASVWNSAGRGFPDVTDNGHNCPVWGACGPGTYCSVDGTSCSSPLFAAKVALLNDHLTSQGKKALGFANPTLYKLAATSGVFRQPNNVTTNACTESECCTPASEFGFSGPPHPTTWNPVSGLGEVNFGNLVTALTES